jgi:excisionase family DNA binding protein
MAHARRRERDATFYTVNQMAALFGVTIWTVYNWARHRRVPVLRVGKSLRFPRVAVDRFIARGTIEPR